MHPGTYRPRRCGTYPFSWSVGVEAFPVRSRPRELVRGYTMIVDLGPVLEGVCQLTCACALVDAG